MTSDQTQTRPIRGGQLAAFLRRDLFTVQLDNGVKTTAMMPEELFSVYNPNLPLTGANRIAVEVEMRDPPALPKIVSARHAPLLGADWPIPFFKSDD